MFEAPSVSNFATLDLFFWILLVPRPLLWALARAKSEFQTSRPCPEVANAPKKKAASDLQPTPEALTPYSLPL